MFKEVPSDLVIINEQHAYEVEKFSIVRILPSQASLEMNGLRPTYRFLASCVVKNSSGEAWAVEAMEIGLLTYVPLSILEPDEQTGSSKK